jgi:hypothetical protein
LQPGFCFLRREKALGRNEAATSDMRDKKDNATLDLVGFDAALPPASPAMAIAPAKRAPRSRLAGIRQHQLELLDETDASGLPAWRRDEGTDLTGLPVWAAAC